MFDASTLRYFGDELCKEANMASTAWNAVKSAPREIPKAMWGFVRHPGTTMRQGMQHLRNSSRTEKGLVAGGTGVGVAADLTKKKDQGTGRDIGRGERIGKAVGTAVGTLGTAHMGFMPAAATGTAANVLGGTVGRGADKLSRVFKRREQ